LAEGRTSSPQNPVPLIPRGSLLEEVEEGDPKGESADPGSPGKMAVGWKR